MYGLSFEKTHIIARLAYLLFPVYIYPSHFLNVGKAIWHVTLGVPWNASPDFLLVVLHCSFIFLLVFFPENEIISFKKTQLQLF